MAAASYTTVSLITECRRIIGDTHDESDHNWMTDAEYKAIIFKHITGDSQSYSFHERASGVWTWGTGGDTIWLYGASCSTGIDDSTYTIYPNGTLEETTSTIADTSDSHTITGTPVNLPEVIVEICQRLITTKCQEAPVSAGSGSYTPPDEERIIRIMELWRGVIGA
jgi:hypothetical protein